LANRREVEVFLNSFVVLLCVPRRDEKKKAPKDDKDRKNKQVRKGKKGAMV